MDFSRFKKIEADLNQISFQGAKLGSSIAQYLYLLKIRKESNNDLTHKEKIFNRLLCSYEYLNGPRLLKNPSQLDSQYLDKILVFISSVKSRIVDFNHNVLEHINHKDALILTGDQGIANYKNIKDYKSIGITQLPKINLNHWRTEFKTIKSRVKKIIQDFCIDTGLISFKNEIFLQVQQKSQLYLSCLVFLKDYKPTSVLVDFDRGIFGATLVIAANHLSIPTYTQIHGVINDDFGYVPLLANFIFVWGAIQKEQLVDLGVSQEKIIISGTPIDKPTGSTKSKKQILEKSGLGHWNKPIVLLATGITKDPNRIALVNTFCAVLEKCKFLKGVIKLHPSEDISFYRKHTKLDTELIEVVKEEVSFEESFVISDLIVVNKSGYGLQAAIRDKPVVCISVDEEDFGFGHIYEREGVPTFRDEEKMIDYLKLFFLEKQSTKDKHRKIMKDLLQRNYNSFGKISVERIVNEICSNRE